MARQETETSGLNREAVIQAALGMLDAVGVEGLSMRALADRLGVKAASLYWHIRDKDQLLELVAEAVLDRVTVPSSPAGLASAGDRRLRRPGAVPQGAPGCGDGRARLPPRGAAEPADARPGAGPRRLPALPEAEAPPTTLVVEAAVSAFTEPPAAAARHAADRTDDARDRLGLVARPGSRGRIRTRLTSRPRSAVAAPPRSRCGPDSLVLVKNRRGGDHGAVELNPNYTWYFKIHGGTWNTVLDLSGLRISGIELDSGAGNVTCTLPGAGRRRSDPGQQRHRRGHAAPAPQHRRARRRLAGFGARSASMTSRIRAEIGRAVGHAGCDAGDRSL